LSLAALQALSRPAAGVVATALLVAVLACPAEPNGVLVDVRDFPYAAYLAAVHRQVTDRWVGRGLQGPQPVVSFEIARDGQVSNVAVKESSGNPSYDRTATRAIVEAAPFPRLPDEFAGPVLRVQLGFRPAGDRGLDERVSSVIARRELRVVDAEPAEPTCRVEVELSDVPSAPWQSVWTRVAPRYGLGRARLVRSTLSLRIEVTRLEALPGVLDKALTETNRLVQEQQDRAGDRERRKKAYIDTLNQRLR
jgi:TonB family protein